MCCRNLKGFSVFGNGAAGNLYTAESQQVGECLVRIGLGRGRGKTGGGKGVERSNEAECGFECAAVGLGQAFFIRAGVWLRLPSMLSRAFRTICRAAGLAAHSPDLSICNINDSVTSAADRIFSMRSGLVSALLHPTSTPRAYGPGCLRCCRSGSPARQGNR